LECPPFFVLTQPHQVGGPGTPRGVAPAGGGGEAGFHGETAEQKEVQKR